MIPLISSAHANLYRLTDELCRLSSPCYVPSAADALRVQARRGVYGVRLRREGHAVKVINLPGPEFYVRQPDVALERISTLILVVDLTSYDIPSPTGTHNRMRNLMHSFHQLTSLSALRRASTVLVWNKIGVFKHKLPYSPLEPHFPDYDGGDDADKAIAFLSRKFKHMTPRPSEVYSLVMAGDDPSMLDPILDIVLGVPPSSKSIAIGSSSPVQRLVKGENESRIITIPIQEWTSVSGPLPTPSGLDRPLEPANVACRPPRGQPTGTYGEKAQYQAISGTRVGLGGEGRDSAFPIRNSWG